MIGELAIARAYAESQMTSTCTITRAGAGRGTWNEATGTYDPPARTTVYAGICKVQDTGRSAGTAEAGEITAAVSALELHLPIDGDGYQPDGAGGVRRPVKDDVARIDANPLDEALVGAEFVVQAPHAATAKTARRLPIEAVH